MVNYWSTFKPPFNIIKQYIWCYFDFASINRIILFLSSIMFSNIVIFSARSSFRTCNSALSPQMFVAFPSPVVTAERYALILTLSQYSVKKLKSSASQIVVSFSVSRLCLSSNPLTCCWSIPARRANSDRDIPSWVILLAISCPMCTFLTIMLILSDLDNIKLTKRGLDLANLVFEEFI